MSVLEGLRLFLEEEKKQLWQETDKLREVALPQITEELFSLFERTGKRIPYEEVYFTRRKFLALFGLRAILEQQECEKSEAATLQKLTEIIREICEEECWALPAHVNRSCDGWKRTVDLFSAETAQTLAELADRLRTQLPVEILQRMRSEVEERVLRPFFTSPVGAYGWEGADHNWNAVCAGAIGSACLHLDWQEAGGLQLCLRRICSSLTHYLHGFAADGTCMEGLGYFTYGMTYFVNFAQELYEYSGGELDLFCGSFEGFSTVSVDHRRHIARFQSKCYFSDGRTVSFSDGSSREKFRVGLSCILAARYPEARLPRLTQAAGILADTCFRFAALKMDFLATRQYLTSQLQTFDTVETAENNASFAVLPEAQWCIANAANGVGMACKGGHNAEPHNHNDVGHVMYEAGGVCFLADLGAGEYTKDYFGAGRYEILCNNSFGHSVPIVDGQPQAAGREFCCRSFRAELNRDGEMKEEGEVAEDKTAQIEMELADAYASGGVRSIRRILEFSMADGSLRLRDAFEAEHTDPHRITEQLVTQLTPVVSENQIFLMQGTIRAMITIAGVAEEEIVIVEHTHKNHEGAEEKLYAIQWEVPLANGSGRSEVNLRVEGMPLL